MLATPDSRSGRPSGGGGRPSAGGRSGDSSRGGQLRIGDAWNAISIIAHSQNNPLKAIAELVENSIDARARKEQR